MNAYIYSSDKKAVAVEVLGVAETSGAVSAKYVLVEFPDGTTKELHWSHIYWPQLED